MTVIIDFGKSSGKSLFIFTLEYQESIDRLIEFMKEFLDAARGYYYGIEKEKSIEVLRSLIKKFAWLRKKYKELGSLEELLEKVTPKIKKDYISILYGSSDIETFENIVAVPKRKIVRYGKDPEVSKTIDNLIKRYKKLGIFITPADIYEGTIEEGLLMYDRNSGSVLVDILKKYPKKKMIFVITMNDDKELIKRLPIEFLMGLFEDNPAKVDEILFERDSKNYLKSYLTIKGLEYYRERFYKMLEKKIGKDRIRMFIEKGSNEILVRNMVDFLKNMIDLDEKYIETILRISLEFLTPLREPFLVYRDALRKHAELFEISSIVDFVTRMGINYNLVKNILYMSIFDKESIKEVYKVLS